MSDDHVGPRVPHDIDDEALLGGVGRVHLAVGEAEAPVLRADDARPASLLEPHPRDLLAGVHEAPHVTGRRVTHDDLVPVGDEAGDRAAAEDLEIVGVGADAEHAQGQLLDRVWRDAREFRSGSNRREAACSNSIARSSTTSGSSPR